MLVRHYPRACGGFSLLEVLVAFAVMALSLGALYQAVGGSVRATVHAESMSRSSLVAQSVLARYPNAPVQGIAATGVTVDGFSWSVRSAPYAVVFDLQPTRRLHRIDVVVTWREAGAERRASVSSLIPEVTQ